MNQDKNPSKRQTSRDTNFPFSPVTFSQSPSTGSPQKNLTGPSRIIRDIIADLFNNIQKWNISHIKGCELVKQIVSIKADNPKTYSKQLEEFVNELIEVTGALKDNIDLFSILMNQAKAFTKLPNVNNPIFFSLDALNISKLLIEICEAYMKEFKVKQYILQNIAHMKNKDNAMFLAACWTHQLNITEIITFKLESLLVEAGHRPIK